MSGTFGVDKIETVARGYSAQMHVKTGVWEAAPSEGQNFRKEFITQKLKLDEKYGKDIAIFLIF